MIGLHPRKYPNRGWMQLRHHGKESDTDQEKTPQKRGFCIAVGLGWIESDGLLVPGRGLEPPRSCPR